MEKIRRSWWLVATAVAVVVLGAAVAVPAWALTSRQGSPPSSPAHDAMHEACTAGDVGAMEQTMEGHMGTSHHQAMRDHMGTGHHNGMGSHSMEGMMGW